MRPTDREIVDRAARLLGVRAPVRVDAVGAATLRPTGSVTIRARYSGPDIQGWHMIEVRRDLQGIARIFALCHEVAHAAQCERLGSWRAFRSAYDSAAVVSVAQNPDARAHAQYRRNRLEIDANERGAYAAQTIARESEAACTR